MRKITQGEIAKRMLESGASQREVARVLGVTRETAVRRAESIGYVPSTKRPITTGNGRSRKACDQPPKGVASKVAGGLQEGAFSPAIYISSRTPQKGVFSGVGVATVDHDFEGDPGPIPGGVPDGRYTMGELRRAVHHCIGGDEDAE